MNLKRLRGRGCWEDAAAFIEEEARTNPTSAWERASILVERSFFTGTKWAEAEQSVHHAERLAGEEDLVGAAASERAYLAYGATLLAGADRSEEARRAIARGKDLLTERSPHWPLLEFRAGLVAENLDSDRTAANDAYQRAHEAARRSGDELLLSYTFRHLGGIAQVENDLAEAFDRDAFERIIAKTGLSPRPDPRRERRACPRLHVTRRLTRRSKTAWTRLA